VHSRCVIAIANAVELATPKATKPVDRAASAAPMPPGTGIALDTSEARQMTKTSCQIFRNSP